jgi:hypothetical protein
VLADGQGTPPDMRSLTARLPFRDSAPIVIGRQRTQPAADDRRTILFLRDFLDFTGGHLKTWDYFQHVRAHPRFDAVAQFTDRSLWDETNPWFDSSDSVIPQRDRFPADALFLGGMTWKLLSERQRHDSRIPIVNIIQHVRHAEEPRRQWLSNRAVRICVSPEVTAAVAATGMCNGPLVTIPNAIDLGSLPVPLPYDERPFDLVIAGKKSPALARNLGARLDGPGRRIRVLDGLIRREEFLDAINQARVSLFVPNPTEGFFLPALEALALRSVVVCPDVVGNRSFCLDGVNCLRPEFEEEALLAAAEVALGLGEGEREELLGAGSETAARHDLPEERAAFHEVLDHLDDLYENG